jgi:hypothetical protein
VVLVFFKYVFDELIAGLRGRWCGRGWIVFFDWIVQR